MCHHRSHHNSVVHSCKYLVFTKLISPPAPYFSLQQLKEVGGVCIIIPIAQKKQLRLGGD